METQQIALKLDILESYYLNSKFQFYILSPAIVDEADYAEQVISRMKKVL